MKNNDNITYTIQLLLCGIFAAHFSPQKVEYSLSNINFDQPPFIRLKSKKNLLHEGFSVEHLFILVKGNVKVTVSAADGTCATVDTIQAPNLIGITELLLNLVTYKANVETSAECIFAKVTPQEFKNAIYSDLNTSKIMIDYLARLAYRNMYKSTIQATLCPINRFVSYLYQHTLNKTRPYTFSYTRKDIAEELHINLRTFYRYIVRLQKEGILHLVRGKIVISEEEFQKIQQAFPDIVNSNLLD